MPELPEVQTVVNYLSDNVLGKTISSIKSPNNHAKTFVDGTLNDFYQILQQKEIHKIWRRGKYIIFNLDEGYLLFHLRMTGRLILQLPIAEDIKYVSAKLTFQDGSELFFRDIRKFGRIYFCNNLDWLEDVRANASAVSRRIQSLTGRRSVKGPWQTAWLLHAIQCMDLTTLSSDDTPKRVQRLCAKARQPIRPELVKSLGVGDEVVTSSGILGRIAKIDGEIMTLEVDKNTRIRILKSHANTKQADSE